MLYLGQKQLFFHENKPCHHRRTPSTRNHLFLFPRRTHLQGKTGRQDQFPPLGACPTEEKSNWSVFRSPYWKLSRVGWTTRSPRRAIIAVFFKGRKMQSSEQLRNADGRRKGVKMALLAVYNSRNER